MTNQERLLAVRENDSGHGVDRNFYKQWRQTLEVAMDFTPGLYDNDCCLRMVMGLVNRGLRCN